MVNSPPIYTATMAKVLEDQGKYVEALSIYRQLLKDEPARPDLIAASARIEQHLEGGLEKKMVKTLEIWVDLLRLENRVKRLRNLENHLEI